MKNLIGVVAVLAATGMAQAGVSTVTEFSLWDHPDGDLNPPSYGLRFDGIFGGGQATFSMDHFGDTTLTVTDDGVNIEIHIEGTLYGGEVDGSGGYLSPESYLLDFTYTTSVNAVADGWIAVGEHAGNTGTLTQIGGPASVYTLDTKADGNGDAFLFLADGHRMPNDTDWIGRGWFQPYGSGGGSQDFLFGATLVPAPGVFGLVGVGGLMMGRRRRR